MPTVNLSCPKSQWQRQHHLRQQPRQATRKYIARHQQPMIQPRCLFLPELGPGGDKVEWKQADGNIADQVKQRSRRVSRRTTGADMGQKAQNSAMITQPQHQADYTAQGFRDQIVLRDRTRWKKLLGKFNTDRQHQTNCQNQ